VVSPLLDLDPELRVHTQLLKDLPFIQQPALDVLDHEHWANI